ncbi:MAG TPA: hypothetical protein VMS22_17220 [Candidatus Eisenbacteria bacterium]|nr:hypothetical protein [Candidatus Eisenbacteria bacterium]
MATLETFVGAAFLLPLAVVIVGGLLVLLLHPLLPPALSALERARFARVLARAARADSHLKAGRIDPALRDIEQAFFLSTLRADARLADQVVAHHTGLLSRILTVIDGLPHGRVRLLSLAKVDRILERRGELQRALLQLRNRSFRDGRRIQLERELRRNAGDLRAAVRELVADVQLLATRRVAVQ